MLNFFYSKKLEKVFQSFSENLDNLDVFLSQDKRQELNNSIKSNVSCLLSYDRNNRLYELIQTLFMNLDKVIVSYLEKQKSLAFNNMTKDTTMRLTLNTIFQNLYLKYLLEHISFEEEDLKTCFNNISTWLMLKNKHQKAAEEAKSFVELLKLYVIVIHSDEKHYDQTLPQLVFLLNKINFSKKSYESLFSILLSKETFKNSFGKELEKAFISKLSDIHITIDSGILDNLTKSYKEDHSSAKTLFNISCKYSNDTIYNNISDAIKNCEDKIRLTIQKLFEHIHGYPVSSFYEYLKESPNVFQDSYYNDTTALITSNFYFSLCSTDIIDERVLIECLNNIIQSLLNNLLSVKETLFSKSLLEDLLNIAINKELKRITTSKLDLNLNPSLVYYKRCLEWYDVNEAIMAEKKEEDIKSIILSSLGINFESEYYNTKSFTDETIITNFFYLIEDYLKKYYLSMPKDIYVDFTYFFEKCYKK